MAILCVHLGRAVQTPQPTLSMFPSSVSSLSPPRSVRFDLHATLYLANSSRRGMVKKVLFFLFFIFFFLSLSLSLSLFSCPPPLSLLFPSLSLSHSLFLSFCLFPFSLSVAGHQPAVNVPAGTDGISVDGEKEKAPWSSNVPLTCLVVHRCAK